MDKPKIILRVDDAGRVPGDADVIGTDANLDYFFKWREACGLQGFPVVYGVSPTWLSRKGFRQLDELYGFEQVAVHGWSHRRGEVVDQEHMRVASAALESRIYIPPFNAYSDLTILDWEAAGGKCFLGGYRETSPRWVRDCLYVPAYGPLYKHARLMPQEFPITPIPIVATLHVPWDTLEEVAKFVERLKPFLVPLQSMIDYVEKR